MALFYVWILSICLLLGSLQTSSQSHYRNLLGCHWNNYKKKTICAPGVPAATDSIKNTKKPIINQKDTMDTKIKTKDTHPIKGHKCLGKNKVMGIGELDIINSFGDTALIGSNGLRMLLNSRNYLSRGCHPDVITPSNYSKMFLLGKSVSWTVDLSQVGCKCVGALYFVNMAQNTKLSGSNDYYCDAAGVGGVHCTEIDVQEANAYAWHSVLHSSQDPNGKDGGYGGGEWSWSGPRDWTNKEYGPNSNCIDTNKPFKVTAHFPIDTNTGILTHMKVILNQNTCFLKTKDIGKGGGAHSYKESDMISITKGLKDGMTPVYSSYTPNKGPGAAQWLSGIGKDKKGPCDTNQLKSSKCGEVKFYDLKIEKMSE